jgi:hypothetical protein
MARQPYMGLGLLISSRLHYHTLFRHTTLGRTPLDEVPARRRDLYLTTHNTHKRQTSMPPVGFEPTILVSEWSQTHALDRTATGIGKVLLTSANVWVKRRTFTYSYLTYNRLRLFCSHWLSLLFAIKLPILWSMNFLLSLYPGKHVRIVVANIMFFTVFCIIHISSTVISILSILHELFSVFVENETPASDTTLAI